MGAGYFAFITENAPDKALRLTVLPFIPFDVVKCFLTAFCYRLIKRALKEKLL